MNLNWHFLLLFWSWGIAPLMLGKLCTKKLKVVNDKILFEYIMGLIANFALFQIICVPMAYLGATVSQVGYLFNGIMLAVCILVIVTNWNAWKKTWENGYTVRKKEKMNPVLMIAIIFILLQIGTCVVFQPNAYSDDIAYMGMINDMASTDVIYGQNKITGLDMEFGSVSYKYRFTSYYVWAALIAQMTNLHPLILCKTIMPILYISLFYMIWWLFGKWIFENDRKKAEYFILFMAVIAQFAGYSQYTISKRLLLYVWNGKTVLAVVVLPFLFLCVNRFMEKQLKGYEAFIIVMIEVAAVMPSLMGAGLAPLVIGASGFASSIRKKSIRPLIQSILLCLPLVCYMVVVLISR